jgi:hypothetical protein
LLALLLKSLLTSLIPVRLQQGKEGAAAGRLGGWEAGRGGGGRERGGGGREKEGRRKEACRRDGEG